MRTTLSIVEPLARVVKPLARIVEPLARVAVLLTLAGCFCPAKREAYQTPAAALGTWQAHLCHDDDVGEYRCLSSRLKQEMGGYQTYFAARAQLLDDQPVLSWLLRHADLAARAIESDMAPDGQTAQLVFEHDGQRLTIGFALETRAFFELDDGQILPKLQAGPFPSIMQQQDGREWLDLSWPRRFPADDRKRIVSIRIEPQWKIDTIDGLMAGPTPSGRMTE